MEKGLFWDVPFFIHTPTEGWLKSEPSNGCWCPLKTEVERVHLSAPLSASLKKKSTPPYFPIRKPSLGAIADKKWNVLFLRNIRLNITVVPPLTRSLMGQKNLAVITRWPRVSCSEGFFTQKCTVIFARRPKKSGRNNEVTVLPRWP